MGDVHLQRCHQGRKEFPQIGESWLVNVYKGKGDALACGSYKGIKDNFGFRPGRGMIDAIFIVRQMQKFLAKKKELWLVFVDLEKAFDRVHREIV